MKTTPHKFTLEDVIQAAIHGIRLGARSCQQSHTSDCEQATKQDVTEAVQIIMAKLSNLAGQLTAVAAQMEKSKLEIVAGVDALNTKVAALEALLADADTTPEIDAAFEAVKAQAQVLDDLNPDPVTPEAPV